MKVTVVPVIHPVPMIYASHSPYLIFILYKNPKKQIQYLQLYRREKSCKGNQGPEPEFKAKSLHVPAWPQPCRSDTSVTVTLETVVETEGAAAGISVTLSDPTADHTWMQKDGKPVLSNSGP